ncbi:hypothetical protein ACVWW1_009094 [Bradyrhizobium sp. JR3.5]
MCGRAAGDVRSRDRNEPIAPIDSDHLRRDSCNFDDRTGRRAALADRPHQCDGADVAGRPALARIAFPPRCARRILSRRGQPRRCGCKSVWARLRQPRIRAGAGPSLLSGIPGRNEPRCAGRRCVHLPLVLGIHVACVLGARDGAPPRSGQCTSGLRLSRHGKLRNAGFVARFRPAVGSWRQLQFCGHPQRPAHAFRSRAGALADAAWAPGRKPAWSRCTYGCRWPIPQHRAMSRR